MTKALTNDPLDAAPGDSTPRRLLRHSNAKPGLRPARVPTTDTEVAVGRPDLGGLEDRLELRAPEQARRPAEP